MKICQSRRRNLDGKEKAEIEGKSYGWILGICGNRIAIYEKKGRLAEQKLVWREGE